MEELNLARCRRISDEAVFHIASLRGLRKLGLAETSVGAKGLSLWGAAQLLMRTCSLSRLAHLTTFR
jgi:hypothetical protein